MEFVKFSWDFLFRCLSTIGFQIFRYLIIVRMTESQEIQRIFLGWTGSKKTRGFETFADMKYEKYQSKISKKI